jgi:serine/threonine protein kinase
MHSADTSKQMPSLLESDGDAFEIVSLLGQGGMGTVYKARQRSLDRVVAVKLLNMAQFASPQSLHRLKREAVAAAAITHPNVVKVYSLHQNREQPFIVMEFVEGRPLDAILAERNQLPAGEAIALFSQLLDALECIHSAGFVHRDIKPSNIIVTADGVAKLMDFGIAKSLDDSATHQSLTQTGAAVGSPWFMSPEQCAGSPVDARSDLYSLACTMYQTISGQPPFAGDNPLEVMFKHLHEQAETLGGVTSPKLSEAIAKAMAKQKEDRFTSAAEFKAELESCSAPEVISQKRHGKRKKSVSLSVGKVALLGSCAVSLVCVVVIAIALQRPQSEPAEKEVRKAVVADIDGVPPENIVPALRRFQHDMDPSLSYNLSKEAFDQLALAEQRVPIDQLMKQYRFMEPFLKESVASAKRQGDPRLECSLTKQLASLIHHWDPNAAATYWKQAAELAEKAFANEPQISHMIYLSAMQVLMDAKRDADYEEVNARANKLIADTNVESGPDAALIVNFIRSKQIQFMRSRKQDPKKIDRLIYQTIEEGKRGGIDMQHQQTAIYLHLVAHLVDQKRFAEAMQLYEKVYKKYSNPTVQVNEMGDQLTQLSNLACESYAHLHDRKHFDAACRNHIDSINKALDSNSNYHWKLQDTLACAYVSQSDKVNRFFHDKEAALEFSTKCIQHARKTAAFERPDWNSCFYLQTHGLALFDNGKFAEADNYGRELEHYATQLNYKNFLCQALYLQGIANYRMNKFAIAEQKLTEALKYAKVEYGVTPNYPKFIQDYLDASRKELKKS